MKSNSFGSLLQGRIYQRQCALDDMTEKLNHTDKYQDLEQEVNFLRNLLENK